MHLRLKALDIPCQLWYTNSVKSRPTVTRRNMMTNVERWNGTIANMKRAKTKAGVMSAYAKTYGQRTRIKRGHHNVVKRILDRLEKTGAKPKTAAAITLARGVGLSW